MSRTGTALRSKTSNHRYRYGDMKEVVVPVASVKTNANDEIAEGDMVFIAPTGTALGTTAGTAYPNSAIVVASVASVADYFAGVALDTSCNGDSDDITIATDGVFEFTIGASSTVKVGDAFNLSTTSGGWAGDRTASCDCYTGSIGDGYAGAVVADSGRIGTVVSKGTTQTTCLVRIQSKVFGGNYVS